LRKSTLLIFGDQGAPLAKIVDKNHT